MSRVAILGCTGSIGSTTFNVIEGLRRQDGDEAMAERRFGRAQAVERANGLLAVSRTVWLEDSVHDVPLQRPELVARVITEHAKSGFFG